MSAVASASRSIRWRVFLGLLIEPWSASANLIRLPRLVCGVVGIAACIESIERASIVAIEGEAKRDPLWQVRIRDEVAAERDQVGIPIGNDGLRRIGFEAARGTLIRGSMICR